jgi:hypothetical protein
MDGILGSIDPSALFGLLLAFLLLLCAGLIYGMRDPTPMPRYAARRVRCPHNGRRFTVELTKSGAVHYCPRFAYGELTCDLACLKAESSRAGRI